MTENQVQDVEQTQPTSQEQMIQELESVLEAVKRGYITSLVVVVDGTHGVRTMVVGADDKTAGFMVTLAQHQVMAGILEGEG